jgi:DNA-binding phage protein
MKKLFSWRVFISFGLLIAFVMLLVSGVILYVSPPGRVANWTDWRMLGLTKRGWMAQHTIFGFTFAILSLCHLFLINWHAFLSYLKAKATKSLNHPVELLAILMLAALFGAGTFYGIQPFSGILEFGDGISNSWESKEKKAPVAHAELMSLVELSLQPGLGGDAGALKTKLVSASLKVDSEKQTLAEIAAANGMTAEKVYEIIAPAGNEKHKLQGEGFGKKTLQQVADEAGVSSTSLKLALHQQDVEAETDMTLKTIAEKNNMQMGKLRQLLEKMISR